eukprot:Rmarinus@m.10391
MHGVDASLLSNQKNDTRPRGPNDASRRVSGSSCVLLGDDCAAPEAEAGEPQPNLQRSADETPRSSGWGLVHFGIQDLFSRISEMAASNRTVQVEVSFVELYNEEIRDLLSDQFPAATVKTVYDQKYTGFVTDATRVKVTTADDACTFVQRGIDRRQRGRTDMNAVSSRSHTILTCYIENVATEVAEGGGESSGDVVGGRLASMLHLVDLAGSERLSQHSKRGTRFKEGITINKSLLTLGMVVRALADGRPHIPYRDSKLTKILQTALGGNSRTAIVCAVSGSSVHVEETHSTLRFAQRAKHVKNTLRVNEVVDEHTLQLREYKHEIASLRRQLEGSAQSEELEKLRASVGAAEREADDAWSQLSQYEASICSCALASPSSLSPSRQVLRSGSWGEELSRLIDRLHDRESSSPPQTHRRCVSMWSRFRAEHGNGGSPFSDPGLSRPRKISRRSLPLSRSTGPSERRRLSLPPLLPLDDSSPDQPATPASGAAAEESAGSEVYSPTSRRAHRLSLSMGRLDPLLELFGDDAEGNVSVGVTDADNTASMNAVPVDPDSQAVIAKLRHRVQQLERTCDALRQRCSLSDGPTHADVSIDLDFDDLPSRDRAVSDVSQHASQRSAVHPCAKSWVLVGMRRDAPAVSTLLRGSARRAGPPQESTDLSAPGPSETHVNTTPAQSAESGGGCTGAMHESSEGAAGAGSSLPSLGVQTATSPLSRQASPTLPLPLLPSAASAGDNDVDPELVLLSRRRESGDEATRKTPPVDSIWRGQDECDSPLHGRSNPSVVAAAFAAAAAAPVGPDSEFECPGSSLRLGDSWDRTAVFDGTAFDSPDTSLTSPCGVDESAAASNTGGSPNAVGGADNEGRSGGDGNGGGGNDSSGGDGSSGGGNGSSGGGDAEGDFGLRLVSMGETPQPVCARESIVADCANGPLLPEGARVRVALEEAGPEMSRGALCLTKARSLSPAGHNRGDDDASAEPQRTAATVRGSERTRPASAPCAYYVDELVGAWALEASGQFTANQDDPEGVVQLKEGGEISPPIVSGATTTPTTLSPKADVDPRRMARGTMVVNPMSVVDNVMEENHRYRQENTELGHQVKELSRQLETLRLQLHCTPSGTAVAAGGRGGGGRKNDRGDAVGQAGQAETMVGVEYDIDALVLSYGGAAGAADRAAALKKMKEETIRDAGLGLRNAAAAERKERGLVARAFRKVKKRVRRRSSVQLRETSSYAP